MYSQPHKDELLMLDEIEAIFHIDDSWIEEGIPVMMDPTLFMWDEGEEEE